MNEKYPFSACAKKSFEDESKTSSAFKATMRPLLDVSLRIQLMRLCLPLRGFSGTKLVQYENIIVLSVSCNS